MKIIWHLDGFIYLIAYIGFMSKTKRYVWLLEHGESTEVFTSKAKAILSFKMNYDHIGWSLSPTSNPTFHSYRVTGIEYNIYITREELQ